MFLLLDSTVVAICLSRLYDLEKPLRQPQPCPVAVATMWMWKRLSPVSTPVYDLEKPLRQPQQCPLPTMWMCVDVEMSVFCPSLPICHCAGCCHNCLVLGAHHPPTAHRDINMGQTRPTQPPPPPRSLLSNRIRHSLTDIRHTTTY